MLRVDIGFEGEVPRCVAVELRSSDGTRVEHRELGRRQPGGQPRALLGRDPRPQTGFRLELPLASLVVDDPLKIGECFFERSIGFTKTV